MYVTYPNAGNPLVCAHISILFCYTPHGISAEFTVRIILAKRRSLDATSYPRVSISSAKFARCPPMVRVQQVALKKFSCSFRNVEMLLSISSFLASRSLTCFVPPCPSSRIQVFGGKDVISLQMRYYIFLIISICISVPQVWIIERHDTTKYWGGSKEKGAKFKQTSSV